MMVYQVNNLAFCDIHIFLSCIKTGSLQLRPFHYELHFSVKVHWAPNIRVVPVDKTYVLYKEVCYTIGTQLDYHILNINGFSDFCMIESTGKKKEETSEQRKRIINDFKNYHQHPSALYTVPKISLSCIKENCMFPIKTGHNNIG